MMETKYLTLKGDGDTFGHDRVALYRSHVPAVPNENPTNTGVWDLGFAVEIYFFFSTYRSVKLNFRDETQIIEYMMIIVY